MKQFSVIAISLMILISESQPQLTAQEESAVDKLRPSVQKFLSEDYMKTDEYLIRFLRVRNLDVSTAKNQLIKMLVWRKDKKIDGILLEEFPDMESQFPFIFDGSVDNGGRPVLFIRLGIFDFRKIALSGKLDRFIRYYQRLLELSSRVLDEINLTRNASGLMPVGKSFTVIDLAGFNLRQHGCISCIQIINQMFRSYEDFYPDLFHRFYIINAPRSFPSVFEVIRPFLSAPTQKAISIFDQDSSAWKAVLLSEVPSDQLPVQYGGTRITSAKPISEMRKVNPLVKSVFDKAMEKLKPQRP